MRYPPGSRIDRYEVIEELGEGAYAESYKACDTETGTTVVLKCLNPNLFADPHNFQRFRREAEVVSRLDHPNVLRSLDDHANRTEPYLVLEYVDGENLRRRIRDLHRPVPIALASDWGHQLADALAYLHEHGIVHRDLKPENVIVAEDGTLRLMDFGTALLEGARRLTWRHTGESLGTPDYMSPEQIKGLRGDVRSDIYGWGVLMYEILTGSVPFSGDNWMATMAAHLQQTPKPLRQLRPEVPAALEAVVLRAMRRQPEHRYQSARELVDDLDHLDTLDFGSFDLSPEEPMGGIAAMDSAKRIWAIVALVAVSFVGIIAVIIALAYVA
jgi:eukaryotic-like serine/threonine-protein kinase